MKRFAFAVFVGLFALTMTACSTNPTAAIENGKVSGLRSHEATTLVKQDIRQKKVDNVIKSYKPIFEIEAYDDKPITISAKRLTVNVPLPVDVLLQETADSESEGVQLTKQYVNLGEKVVKPIAIAGIAGSVMKTQSDNAKEVAVAASAERAATAASLASVSQTGIEAAAKDPVIITVPEGSAVLPASPE